MTINSGFFPIKTWGGFFPVRYVSHYQRVIPWKSQWKKTPTKTRRQPHTTRPTVKALLLAVPFGESVALLAFLGAPAPWNFADRSFRFWLDIETAGRSIDDLLLTIGEYLLMILNDIEWYWWILMIYWWFIADKQVDFFFQYQPLLGFAQIVTLDSADFIVSLPSPSNQQSSIIVHLPPVIKPYWSLLDV